VTIDRGVSWDSCRVAFIIPRRKKNPVFSLQITVGSSSETIVFNDAARTSLDWNLTGLYFIRSRSSSLGFWQIFRGPVSWAEGL